MEQQPQKQAAPAEGEGAPKKRRRRGGRRHKSKQNAAPAQQAAVKPAEKAEKPEKREKSASQPRPVKAEKPARQRPVREQPRREAKEAEVDDSIQLISRRAPAQKFASFEEYMKAHGMGGGEDEE